MKPTLMLACSLLMTACCTNRAKAEPVATTENAPQIEDAPRTPLWVKWNVLSNEGGRLRIAAVVVRRARLNVPIDVHIEAPDGLELVSGTPAFQLDGNLEPGETVSTLEYNYRDAPTDDLKLIADITGSGMGVHATDVYRFGRTAPQPRPRPSGPHIKVGNTDLGPAIQIDKDNQ